MRTPPVAAAHTSSCNGVRHLIRTRKWNGEHPWITLSGVPASALGGTTACSQCAAGHPPALVTAGRHREPIR